MDAAIPYALYLYGVALFLLVAGPQGRWLGFVFLAALPVRLFCIGFRTTIGSDIESYTAVLMKCDLSSINALELFWSVACLPSAGFEAVLPFPFLWIGLLDCVLFYYLAKIGGWRIAALHDLIYLQTTGMGAIRQALAMKLVVLAVLLFVLRRPMGRDSNFVLAAPLIHLAAVVPAAMIRFATGGAVLRLAVGVVLAVAASQLVDEALLWKLAFYLEFEGFRTAQDMYASWVKRGFIVVSALILTTPSPVYWGLYAVALLFAATEFYVPEIAVRIGAYFEQFEIFLIGACMRRRLRKLSGVWYGTIALAYTARYMVNIGTLPH